ncbi:MAG: GNAT family N-acetyltransferase [Burkholderiales bacterium]|nr:GNAT family N-acetyltransferase [Burkholderiales bacterium]
MFEIRAACAADAARHHAFFTRLIDTADTMLLLPDEARARSVEQARAALEQAALRDNHCVLIALDGEQQAGFLSVTGGMAHKNRGVGYLVMGVDPDYRRRGVGKALFAAAEVWARQAGMWRLELTVMHHNDAARALYRNAGFVEEGIKRHALHWQDRFVDEVMMARLLQP